MTVRGILDKLPRESRNQLLEELLKTVLKSKNVDKADPAYIRKLLYIAGEGLLKSAEGVETVLYMALHMEREKTLSILSKSPEFESLRSILEG